MSSCRYDSAHSRMENATPQKQADNNVTHRNITRFINFLAIIAIFGIGILVTACNAKDDEPSSGSNYVSTESVAVTAFSLKPDIRIMKNLDSVFFSIDLEHGVIFNADSLPKGTNITKLVPNISYPSSVTSATIEMTGGTHREGTVNYYANANDTIDFTGNVILTLGSSKDGIQKSYRLKVNVHQEDPDTVYWDTKGTTALPSRLSDPKEQKTVGNGKEVVTLIEESDGSYTVAKTTDIFAANWTRQTFSPAFTPVIHTLTVTPSGKYHMLDSEGNLMESEDVMSWQQLEGGWYEIIGMYGDVLIGTSQQQGALHMKTWPSGAIPEMQLPEEFPLKGFSAPIEFTNRWTPYPTIVIFGGYPYGANGKSPSWAFDGTQWVNIAEDALPALEGISVVDYYSYLNSDTNGLLKEFEVYLAFGGKDINGNINNTVYVSYDHGINWQRAQSYMQMPAGTATGYMVDALTMGTTMQSNLGNRWKVSSERRRLPFEIDGDLVKWECPYIFLFGGYDANSTLNSKIRSGVLQRLTFEPLF